MRAPSQSRWRIAVLRVLGRPGLCALMWLLSLGTAALALLPTGLALYAGLADRPAAVKLARGQADALRSELFSVDGGIASFGPMLLGGLVVAVLVHWLLQTLLSGGIVASLLRPGHPAHVPPGRVLLRAAETASAMLRLELCGLFGLRLPLCIVAAALAYLLAQRPELVERTPLALGLRFAPLVVLFLWLWSAISVVVHYARILYLSGSHDSAVVALQGAVHLATRSRGLVVSTLGLGLISLVGYGLLIVLGHLGAAALDRALFVVAAFTLRQLAALLRSGLSLSIIAGSTEVWHDLAGQGPARAPSSGL